MGSLITLLKRALIKKEAAMSSGSRPLCNILKLQFSSKLKVGERKNLLSALRTFATSITRASDTPQDQSKLREYEVSSMKWSSRRSIKDDGETKRESKEKLFSFIALLVLGLAGIGVLVYTKATNASEKDD